MYSKAIKEPMGIYMYIKVPVIVHADYMLNRIWQHFDLGAIFLL